MSELIATFNWVIFLLVFLCYAVTDGLYSHWMYTVAERKPLPSALTAMSILLIAAFGVISYTSNPLYVIAMGLGSCLGSYVVVRRKANKVS